jgi:hypothetical protein
MVGSLILYTEAHLAHISPFFIEGSRELEPFNLSFISAWKITHNFKMWASLQHEAILEVPPGHPYSGQLSVADMKLRLSQ